MTGRKLESSEGLSLSNDDADASSPSTFADGLPLPKLIIFDLDYTLWPFWVDTHVLPPLTPKEGNTYAIDRTGESFAFYPEVPSVLYAARAIPIPLALASRTHKPHLARSLLAMLNITPPPRSKLSGKVAAPLTASDFFAHQEIFPDDKRKHMKNLQKAAGVAFEDMLFFDDEIRNSNVGALGVCFWLVREGVTRAGVDAGVTEWRRRQGVD